MTTTPLPRASRVPIEEGLAIIDPAHGLLSYLAQSVLAPFWEAFPGGLTGPLPPAREAARAAIRHWNEGGSDDTLAQFRAALAAEDPAQAEAWEAFVRAILWREDNRDLRGWRMWFSGNQHRQGPVGRVPGAVADGLRHAYRDEVVARGRAIDDLLEGLAEAPLDDWDLWLHAQYAYSLIDADRFDTGRVRRDLSRFADAKLFETFLRAHVLTLAPNDQEAVTGAVRAFWADLWGEPVDGPAGLMLTETAEDAERISSVREMLG
ncbi:hypothetical protein JMM59_17745 [Rhodovulum sulfidophilum]|uniref:hypothetical protein n=1 Tax=Rhodovulum sulfidophilum TaxID=35806 RepID=UPI0019205D7C|nr:hypothetical protein [Rhodovulum sulfidophilum]MBL3566839.1 hypothetical protein [Rhodovulum sulfidophilum]